MLYFRVENDRQTCEFTHDRGPIVFGRSASKTSERFVVEDQFVSRTQLQIEESQPGTIQLENFGSGKTTLSDGTVFEKGQCASLQLPVRLTIGFTCIEISLGKREPSPTGSLETIVQSRLIQPDDTAIPLVGMGTSPPAEKLTKWFETLICVHQAAAGTDQFYAETAKAVVDLVGLDRGLVILFEKQQPRVVASHAAHADTSLRYSQTVLSQVVQNKRTYYENSLGQAAVASLANIEAVVASPIFDVANEVVGVVFGSRDVHPESPQRGITPLEAQVIQLLASAVSVGLARVEKEAEAARTQVQLEQFASRELVSELKRNADLLDARDRELTVLFADLRGFSSISERLGAKATYQLARDVMDRLTDRIVEYGGFIIHYAGDGLAAMWNAPIDQLDHPERACHAALAMQAEMLPANEQWEAQLQTTLKIGIGINTGNAQVGNSGSKWRIKYAPLGHMVNVASRVEGVTKQVGIRTLVTRATYDKTASDFAFRRLCKVRVAGIDEPIELFELHGETADPNWSELRNDYEQSLSLYERNERGPARQLLQRRLAIQEHSNDIPSQLLLDMADDLDSDSTSGCIFEFGKSD